MEQVGRILRKKKMMALLKPRNKFAKVKTRSISNQLKLILKIADTKLISKSFQ